MFIPNSDIKLLNEIDITNENDNTFSFGSVLSQTNFFTAKSKYDFPNMTYVRKERYLKVERNIEDLFDVSYLMFQNTNFGTKWFYAFITDLQYLNDSTTKVFFEIDEVQTWYFDIDIKDCMIEREHVEDDTIGTHRIEEGLSTGEYVIRATDTFTTLNEQAIIVASTYNPTTSSDVIGQVYTAIYSGAKYFAFDKVTGIVALQTFLAGIIGTSGKESAIVNIFMCPKNLLPSFSDGDAITLTNALILPFNYVKNVTDLDGYVPKNKKMFIYPYNLLYVSNHNGSVGQFRYELI